MTLESDPKPKRKRPSTRAERRARATGKPHRFPKGKRPGPGRAPGQRNKITRELKEAILNAAEMAGSNGKGKDGLNGYLYRLAMHRNPKIFGALLAKLLPMQLTGEGGKPLGEALFGTAEEILKAMRERGLPPPPSLIDVTPNSSTTTVPEIIEAEIVAEEQEEN